MSCEYCDHKDQALDEMVDRIRDLHIEMERLQKLLTDNGIEFGEEE